MVRKFFSKEPQAKPLGGEGAMSGVEVPAEAPKNRSLIESLRQSRQMAHDRLADLDRERVSLLETITDLSTDIAWLERVSNIVAKWEQVESIITTRFPGL